MKRQNGMTALLKNRRPEIDAGIKLAAVCKILGFHQTPSFVYTAHKQ
jgi:hypothetical protein